MKQKAKYLFGDIVVVEKDLIGVVVKTWEHFMGELLENKTSFSYEIYVRNYRTIKTYLENDVERYRVRHKELSEQELEWQSN